MVVSSLKSTPVPVVELADGVRRHFLLITFLQIPTGFFRAFVVIVYAIKMASVLF